MKVAICLLLCAPVYAQGDSCSNPTLISGEGSWVYECLTESVPPLQGDESCLPWFATIDQPTWHYFEWTPLINGDYRFTMSESSFSTGVEARLYGNSSCSQTCASSWTSSLGVSHWLEVSQAVAGRAYLLQIRHAATAGSQFELEVSTRPTFCAGQSNDPLEPNNIPSQAWPLPLGTITGLKLDPLDRDLFAWQVPPGTRLWVEGNPTGGDVDFAVYSASGEFLHFDDFGGYYVNTTSQVQTAIVELLLGFGGTAFCTEYSLTASLQAAPCGLPPIPLAGQGTNASPYALQDGTYLGLPNGNPSNPMSQAAHQLFCFLLFPDGHLDLEIQAEPAMGEVSLALYNAGPAFAYDGIVANGSTLVTQNVSTAGIGQISWTHLGAEPRTYCLYLSGDCGTFDLHVSGIVNGRSMPSIGSTVCGALSPNSQGTAAVLYGYGSDLWQSNGLWLITQGLPQDSPAMLIGGKGSLVGTLPATLGSFCLSGQLFNRYHETLTLVHGGDFETWLDLHLSQPGRLPAALGETWTFQCWYRDQNGASAANLSTALRVTLQ